VSRGSTTSRLVRVYYHKTSPVIPVSLRIFGTNDPKAHCPAVSN
jgi:hypothetical protein